MSGIGILRRDGADFVTDEGVTHDKRAARRNAFEANLALQLEKTLGGDASLSDIDLMTRALGDAYQKMKHAMDARSTVRLDVRRYVVLQAGWAPRTGDPRLDTLDPFAAKLLSSLPQAATEQIEPRLKAVGAALGKTEISRRHPTDLRLRLSTPWVRLYVNFLSGKDRRDQYSRVTHNRRKPVNENIGFCVLLTIAALFSVLGASLVAGTLWALFELMLTQDGRDTLWSLLNQSIATLSSCLSGLRWLS